MKQPMRRVEIWRGRGEERRVVMGMFDRDGKLVEAKEGSLSPVRRRQEHSARGVADDN